MSFRTVAVILVLSGCGGAAPRVASPPPAVERAGATPPAVEVPAAQAEDAAEPVVEVPAPASPLSYAGARLGDTVAEFFVRAGLEGHLCDTDPIQDRARRIWFFAPCRNAKALPDGVVVVLFSTPERRPDRAKVDAVMWAFADVERLEFPARVGMTPAELDAALGAGTRLFEFDDVLKEPSVVAVSYPGERYAVLQHGRALGFVVGRMGRDRDREEWRGMIANVLRARGMARKAGGS